MQSMRSRARLHAYHRDAHLSCSLALTAGLALLYARIEYTAGAVDQLMASRADFQNKGWQGVIIQPEVVVR